MSGFSFGNPSQQQAAGFSFGTSAAPAAASTPAFGAAAAPTFGANAATATTGFGATGFGAATTAQAPAFGATANPTATVAPFGASATTAAPAFGAPPTAAVAPTFGTAAPTFGATAVSSAAPSFNFGGLGGTATTANAPTSAAPAFGFGGLGGTAATSTATSTAPTLGFSGLGGGLSFGKPAGTTTSASLNFGTTTTSVATGGMWKPAATSTTATATPFVGLGGVDVSSTQPKAGDLKQDSVKIKETIVPDEIAKTVDTLKSHIKAQKTLSSDIGRTSTSKLSNVSNEINNIQWALQEISNSVDTNYKQIKLLRKETSKTIQAVEMAQRTQDTPAGLQFENTAPFQFFLSLVAKYEQDLINFRQQIALTEHHMRSLTNPQTVSPDDLKRGFRQINESFVSLAGRLHELHQKVETQKEQFLNLRKYRLRDTTNVFAKIDNPESKVDTANITCGPTPFSNISAMSAFGKSFNNASAAAAGRTGNAATAGAK
ncbi:nuclear pore complex protein Nup58 [Zeugodacus cucurbitae]|uniref:Probable nucleoporin Nup58 n=1 Tax=Zeugodacus cucurbitae TaxID=28588 RepID=A0A0A1WEF2_ZEUCU|nr:nuclear pore complex protein Nup58 [Zeugodacus cucurbitae]